MVGVCIALLALNCSKRVEVVSLIDTDKTVLDPVGLDVNIVDVTISIGVDICEVDMMVDDGIMISVADSAAPKELVQLNVTIFGETVDSCFRRSSTRDELACV